jgi:hypothetical protein
LIDRSAVSHKRYGKKKEMELAKSVLTRLLIAKLQFDIVPSDGVIAAAKLFVHKGKHKY